MMSIKTLLYLYFDAAEYKLRVRLDSITQRILLNGRKIPYEDALKILSLMDRLEFLQQVERELYKLLDGFD